MKQIPVSLCHQQDLLNSHCVISRIYLAVILPSARPI